jgi:hypothetical protein
MLDRLARALIATFTVHQECGTDASKQRAVHHSPLCTRGGRGPRAIFSSHRLPFFGTRSTGADGIGRGIIGAGARRRPADGDRGLAAELVGWPERL